MEFSQERQKGNNRYGRDIIENFNPETDLVTWGVKTEYANNNYRVEITHPEWAAKCPVSGYPDTGTITVMYVPNKFTVELKAFKLYINSFRDKFISHEDCANEVFNTLWEKLEPKWLQVVLDPAPRGNVYTKIKIEKEG